MIGSIVIGILVIVLIMVLLPKLWKKGEKVEKTHSLLLGGKGSGKTSYLLRLSRGEAVESYTSSEMNIIEVDGHKIIDFPANERLRGVLMKEKLLERSRHILFLIDGYEFQQQAYHKDIMQYLYEVLSYGKLHAHPPVGFHILFHKWDLLSAPPAELLPQFKQQLQEEFHIWIQTKEKHQLADLSNDVQDRVRLGYEEEAFRFDDLPFPIHIDAVDPTSTSLMKFT